MWTLVVCLKYLTGKEEGGRSVEEEKEEKGRRRL
jgi:hypothetical protein